MTTNMKLITLFIVIIGFSYIQANKYSEEMNTPKYKFENNFRMQKIKLLWEKALKKLSKEKLKALHMDLVLQDKEEIAVKKLKSAGLDKDGLKEATLRKALNVIINKYGLADHFVTEEENTRKNRVSSEVPEEVINKRLFKDKKLNKLWAHVEKSEFSDEELKALKEEFQHHQEKLNLYHDLVDETHKKSASFEPEEMDNSVETLMKEESKKKSLPQSQQLLKKQYHDLRQDYNFLAEKVLKGKGIVFEESRVNKLWELAQKADFTSGELESLKEELHHYEHRVKKLKFLEAELDLSNERFESKKYDKTDGQKERERRVKDYNYKVNKIHNEIESRILQRHLEL